MRRLLNGSLLAAMLLALLGGGATYLALAGDPAVAADEGGTVLVLVRDLSVGARISAGDLREERAETNTTVFQGAATSLDQVVGRYALLPMLAGELLIQAKVGAEPPGSGLAVLIPPGRVAVSVAVNDVIRTGGFIAPGDRVDVLGVVSQEATGSAALILQDIAVLAVSDAVVGDAAGDPRTGADNPRSLDTTVTLAVTPDEARRLVQVDELGKLRLALRPRVSATPTD